MADPDMLRFVGGSVERYEVGWTGPWPPPLRMGLAVGTLSGIVKVFEPDALAPDVVEQMHAVGAHDDLQARVRVAAPRRRRPDAHHARRAVRAGEPRLSGVLRGRANHTL